MIKLIESGLFGHRLFPVDRPLMVKRYNQCLTDIGLEPTKLESFHIDGMGWSPEIADEKSDSFYLSHGHANPFGIILSPEQGECPLYMPFHTFDWEIHRRIFDQLNMQIQDVTGDNAVWFELDQKISAYRSTGDVLMMDVVEARFHVSGELLDAAREQKELVQTYSNSASAWMDRKLRKRIIDSAKKHGDLRYRNVELPDLPFSQLASYYTVAFGGMYVFKNSGRHKPVIILKNNSSQISGKMGQGHVEYNANDLSFISYLFNQGLLDSDPAYFKTKLYLLEQQLDYMLIQGIMKMDPENEVQHLNETQKKGMVNRLVGKELLDQSYFDLERLISQLKRNSTASIPASLNQMLLHPKESTSREEKIVLWQLLANVQDNNPILKYTFDKSAFYAEYQAWTDPLREWAISRILRNRDIFKQLIH